MQYVESEALTKESRARRTWRANRGFRTRSKAARPSSTARTPSRSGCPRGWACCSPAAVPAWRTISSVGESIKRNVSRRWQADRRGLWPLPPALPALPRRLRGGRRPDRAVPLSHAPRLPPGHVQVHLHAQRGPAASRRPEPDGRGTVSTARRCRRSRRCSSEDEIEQVVDYVIFLSIRGETELELIDEGAISDENDLDALSAGGGHGRRRRACSTSGRRPRRRSSIRRSPAPRRRRESILRGRELFLGRVKDASWTAPTATGCWPAATARASCPRSLQPRRLRRQSQRAARSGSTSSTTR